MAEQTVMVWLKDVSEPAICVNVTNTYIEGWLFCVCLGAKRRVLKFPERNIVRIEQEVSGSEGK